MIKIETNPNKAATPFCVLRYAYNANNTWFITPDKFCPIKDSRLKLLLTCEFADEPINGNDYPKIGTVLMDINKNFLKVIEIKTTWV